MDPDARPLASATQLERVREVGNFIAPPVFTDVRPDSALARWLRTGMVDVNGGRFNPFAPFGGYKQSGNGRELGQHGLEEFLEVKSIQL